MEQPRQPPLQLRPGSLMASGLKDLFKPPLAVLLLLELLIFGVLSTMPDEVDDASLFGVLVLAVVSAFMQIALTLAASSQEQRTADEWVKLAFRRGVFWRLILTSFVTFAAILLGLLALIIGGLVLGGMLGLSQTAAIQERAWPGTALRSSVALSRGHRVTIGAIFAITFIVPNALVQTGTELQWDQELGLGWDALGAVGTVVTLIGVVALARAYVSLGGKPTETAPATRSLN
jgi:hypothetical protein